MAAMRAAMFDSYGSPDVLYIGEVPEPTPAAGELLVGVRALSVNGGEVLLRSGKVGFATGTKFPKRTGVDFVGEVMSAGSARPAFPIGSRVWGAMPRGRYHSAAEYVAVPTDKVSPVPVALSDIEAASLPGATTIITALRDKASLRAGERLLVRGANGGMGSAAVQLGKYLGAEVTAMASARSTEFVRELGADHVIDYSQVPVAELGVYDVILDTVGTDQAALRSRLSRTGRMVSLMFDLNRIFTSVSSVLVSTIHRGQRVRFFSGNPNQTLFQDLRTLVEAGALRPMVDGVFPLERIGDAHRALEAGGVRGKHIVTVVS